jgi:hypothetical protein
MQERTIERERERERIERREKEREREREIMEWVGERTHHHRSLLSSHILEKSRAIHTHIYIYTLGSS